MGNGNFIVTRCASNPEDIAITNTVMRVVGRTVASIHDLDQWQFILEDQKGDEPSPHYALIFTSTKGKGESCAVEKINTLKNYPYVANTGDIKKRLFELKPDEVDWYGGINVSYAGFEGIDSTPVNGVVRIAFSGAKEAIDLVIVLKVLKTYIEVCDRLLTDATYLYNLDQLKADQLSGYLMDVIF